MSPHPTAALGPDDLVLCSGTVRSLGLVETARLAAATGYSGISVYLHEVRTAVARGWTLARLRSALDDLGVRVAEVDGVVDWIPGAVSTLSAPVPVAEAVEVAHALGARSITALESSGRPVVAAPHAGELALDVVQEAFARFCGAAGDGTVVHVEYFPFSGIADFATAAAVAAGSGAPNGGVMVDVWHHVRGGDRGDLAVLRTHAPLVRAVQCNDAAETAGPDVRRECMHGRCLPGAGTRRCAAVVAALRAGGCDAPLEVEVFADDLDARGPAEAARRALAATRAVAAAAALDQRAV